MPEDDVATTLSELERKLKELEEELQESSPAGAPPLAVAPAPAPMPALPPPGITSAPAPSPFPVPEPPPAPEPLEPPRAPAPDPFASAPPVLEAQVAELLRFREQLERSARELMADYERVLESLRITTDAALGTPTPPAAPPTPWKPAPGSGLDGVLLDGSIVVDAGPFTDIGTLSGFERALGGVPGVSDVYVRGFEGSRAQIDVTLDHPVALGTELRATSRVPFTVTHADAGRLAVAIEPGS